jgi:hypothetical protein
LKKGETKKIASKVPLEADWRGLKNQHELAENTKRRLSQAGAQVNGHLDLSTPDWRKPFLAHVHPILPSPHR